MTNCSHDAAHGGRPTIEPTCCGGWAPRPDLAPEVLPEAQPGLLDAMHTQSLALAAAQILTHIM